MFKFIKHFLATFCIFVLLFVLIKADVKIDEFNKTDTTKLQNTNLLKSITLNRNSQISTLKGVQCKLTTIKDYFYSNNYKNWKYENLENWVIGEENTLKDSSFNKSKIREVPGEKNEFTIEPSENVSSIISCQEYRKNCTIICSNGDIISVNYNSSICRNIKLNLMLEKCIFYNGILEETFFSMNFSLGLLSINECNLMMIKAGAFRHKNVKWLHTLLLTNNRLIFLQDITFEDLNKLLHFKFFQNVWCCEFESKGVLRPMANTLKDAHIQIRANSSEVIDPINWWLGLNMNCLTVLDISNTNLNGILNGKTFQTFVNLKSLRLMNCNLFSFEPEVLQFIWMRLRYLDLRFNHLQTLDSMILYWVSSSSLFFQLSFNGWNCNCDTDIIQYFIQTEEEMFEKVLCSTPEEYQEMEMMRVVQECRKNDYSRMATPSINTIDSYSVENTREKAFETTNEMPTVPNTIETATTNTFTSTVESSTDKTVAAVTTTATAVTNNVPINCFLDKKIAKAFWKNIARPNSKFTVYFNTSTSVTIKVPDCYKFTIFYFPNHDKCDYTDYSKCLYRKTSTKSEAVIYIKDLIPSTAYLFCLVKEELHSISPFDCQSQFMEINELKTAWLLQTDKVWFITVNTIAAVFLFFLSGFVVYRILRCNSHRMLNASPVSVTSSKYLFDAPLQQNASNNGNIIYTSKHTVPSSKAPILPPSTAFTETPNKSASLVEKDYSIDGDYLNIIDLDPHEQTVANYETIN